MGMSRSVVSSPKSSSWPPCGVWNKAYRSPKWRGLEANPNVPHRWRREFRHGPGNAFPGNGKHRGSEGADCGTGAQGRPADAGDRFFEGVLATHRGAADAAGADWKSAVYRKVQGFSTRSGKGVGREIAIQPLLRVFIRLRYFLAGQVRILRSRSAGERRMPCSTCENS